MPCVRPKLISQELIPCGTCIGCRRDIALEWKLRCLGEMNYHEDATFLTLTYNDDMVEELNKRAFQLFMKRLRFETKLKIKYYACGEYGTEGGRPHYHALIFGLSSNNPIFDSIPNTNYVRCKLWENGFVFVGTVTPKSVTYVTGYLTKVLPAHLRNEKVGSLAPPFRLMSKGIGQRYFVEKAEQFAKTLSMTYEGVAYRLPKHWLQQLKIQYPETKERLDEIAIATHWRQLIDTIQNTGSLEIRDHLDSKISNLRAREIRYESDEAIHYSNKLHRRKN